MRYDLVIVGGGYAGIAAAEAALLAEPGARVLVLEAAEILGGRTRSVEIAPGYALDLGAHYFGPAQRRITALARRLAPSEIYAHPSIYDPDPAFRTFLDGTWRETRKSTSFLDIQGLSRTIPLRERAAMFASLGRYISHELQVNVEAPWSTAGAAELDAVTVTEFIRRQEGPRWIQEMWGLGVLDILSVHAHQLSLLYWLWYNRANGGFLLTANDFTGGPQEHSVRCGLGGLLLRYAAEVRSRGAELLTDAHVRHVEHRADGVSLELLDGRSFEAATCVIATTPSVAGRIRYSPDVSAARRLLHAQRPGHSAKVCAVYDAPFWRDDPARPFMGYTAGPGARRIEWGLDTTAPGGPPSLSLFVSDQLLDAAGPSDEARKAAIREALVDVTGDPRAASPRRLEVWDWRDVETVGGGPNTVFAPGVLSRVGAAFGRPEAPHERLFFAAAEYSTSFPGYVEGALCSGAHAAAQAAWRRDERRRPAPELPRGPRPHRRRALALRGGAGALAAVGRLLPGG